MRALVKWWIGIGIVSWLSLGVGTARAEHTRVTNPSAVSVEILGRGVLWSVGFDRVLDDHLAAGIGIGSVGVVGSDAAATMIPAYFNYYFAREQGSLYATAGISLIANSGAVQGLKASSSGLEFPSSPVLPTFGIGYENRSDAGFLFRVTAYGLVGQNVVPWGGLTIGWSF